MIETLLKELLKIFFIVFLLGCSMLGAFKLLGGLTKPAHIILLLLIGYGFFWILVFISRWR
ncbi:MAG: hypothetical protein AAB568_01810 [Patescibacteria group bacterium]